MTHFVPFETVLEKICELPEAEAEWLEMLSQLEYAGCRKIVKGVPFERVDPSVLKHVMEEASHAYLLKSVVEALRPDPRPWKACPLTAIGWEYFQGLDHAVSKLQPEVLPYPLVSWIVEQRVLEVYPLYLEKTREPRVARVLRRIFAQEVKHSEQFEGLPERVRNDAREIESRLWERFVTQLNAWVDSLRRAASVPAGQAAHA